MLGEQLFVDRPYLERTIDALLVFGLQLTDRCWMRFARNEASDRDALLVDYLARYAAAGHWSVVVSISQHMLGGKLTNESHKLDALAYRSLAKKRRGEWAEIREEIEEFDTEAYNPTYAVAVHSLRDDRDSFYRDLPAAVSSGLDRPQLLHSPFFEEMRHAEEFHSRLEVLLPASTESGDSDA